MSLQFDRHLESRSRVVSARSLSFQKPPTTQSKLHRAPEPIDAARLQCPALFVSKNNVDHRRRVARWSRRGLLFSRPGVSR